MSLGFSAPIYWEIQGDCSLTYDRTSFNYNPLFATEGERLDNKYVAAISLTRPISDMFQLALSYIYTGNNSNISSGGIDPYEFKKNVFSLMITGLF